MIITLVIVALLALIFGKITFKELKEHVSKFRAERYKGANRADGRDYSTGTGDRKEGGINTHMAAGFGLPPSIQWKLIFQKVIIYAKEELYECSNLCPIFF